MMMMMMIESTLVGCEYSTIYYALALEECTAYAFLLYLYCCLHHRLWKPEENKKIKFPRYTPMALQWILQIQQKEPHYLGITAKL